MSSSEKSIPNTREFLKHIINQGIRTSREIQETYALMNRADIYGMDDEQWQKQIDALKECQWKMSEVCQYLVDMDKQLAELDISVLYGPPPFFDE